MHVKLIERTEIHRLDSDLKGVEGTQNMYHFGGANTQREVAEGSTSDTTEAGQHDSEREMDWKLVSGAVQGVVQGLTVLKTKGWKSAGDPLIEPISGLEPDVVVRKVVRTFHLKTRSASFVLLRLPAASIQGLPHPQDAAFSRPKTRTRYRKGDGHHGYYWGSGRKPTCGRN